MILLIPLIGVVGALVVIGFVKSRNGRRLDRRHLAGYVGFSAAMVAIGATLLWALAGIPSHPTAAWQGFLFVIGCVGIISTVVAFVAGFLSRGAQRFQLLGFGFVIACIYLLVMFSHFGD